MAIADNDCDCMNLLFFELIQVALGRREYLRRVPSAKEWNALYTMAQKQTVAGVFFCGLQRLPNEQRACLPELLKMQWLALATQIQARNELMNRRCVEVQRLLAKEGLKSSILKGQGVAVLYNLDLNLNLYRQSGNIDVWMDSGMERVLRWCRERYGDVEFDYINAHVPIFDDVEVELHWRVQSMTNLFRNRRLQRWLEREKTKAMILDGKADLKLSETLGTSETTITVPSLEFNAFYLMLHCYHQMFESGLGLRQLMDYYFLLRNLNLDLNLNKRKTITGTTDERSKCRGEFAQTMPCKEEEDRRATEDNFNLNQLFREFGMERFVKGVMWIMQEVFGLERECLLCEPDEKEGRFILTEVMAGGNFGHHDARIRKVGKGKWRSVFANLQHALQVLRRYPQEAIWMPVWMVYHFIWKRTLKIR